jgi:hyperosmotically inducible periplasmic protein
MKPRLVALSLVACGAILGPALSHASSDGDSDRSHPVTFVKDSEITAKIKAKLAAEHLSSLGTIHIDTDANGIVYLTGSARSRAQIDKAVAIAWTTERVRGVKNELVVKADD